ncbi:MAG: M3 family metallopeptidase [Alphaproteobacteria bacterium]|nr:M3 family metallopeptidase [Alphaproteobacteria bacterium]
MTFNPLFEISNLPNYAPAFDLIKTEHYLPAVESSIEKARKNINTIKSNIETPDFENTIVALETSSELLGQVTGIFYNQLSCMGGDELHDLVEKIGPLNANFSSDIILDTDLFKRIKNVYDKRESLNLNIEQFKLLDETYKDFVRGGALLDNKKKKRLRQINEALSTLSPTFMNNVNKSAENFELIITNKDDLAGLPKSAIDTAKHSAEEKDYKDKWLFTLDYPSYIPFVQYADNRNLRKKIWHAFASRAWKDEYDNCENILKITALRHERAQLLGYDTHAHYVLERRMAETPETVFNFLKKTKNVYKSAAKQELKELQEFAQKTSDIEELQPWDVSYYSEKLKQKLFNFSSEDLRPYFQLDKVLNGCFEHFSKLFNLRFEQAENYPTWHKDVKTFDVYDKTNNAFIGTLYGDFHPRIGKKPGAWMTTYRGQGLFQGKIERPLIAIICNFTKPTANKPSLITHGEVTTLFHEMGHAIHGLLSNVTYSSLSSPNVLWDFVELPSQVQENWCYEKETLDLFAQHYESGEKIPKDLIKKLRSAKNFMIGWSGLRQTSFGNLDMMWHTVNPDAITDVAAFEDKHTKDTSLFPRLAGPFSCSFGHIFAGGYSAGYYSYKWAEVLDADIFEVFLKNGLYDQKTATRYKNEILSKGGSQHPSILYKNFRTRDADPNALLRREGLLQNSAKMSNINKKGQ